MKLKAIVFDADGTIFDTKELIYAAYEHLARTHGHPVPTRQDVDAIIGRPLKEMLVVLFPGADIEALYETNQRYFLANMHQTALHNDLHDLLESLARKDIKLAILTSGPEEIHDLLAHNRLEKVFTSVVHRGRVAQPKPDPEGFMLAMQECGTIPAEAIMVGDLPIDMETGANAGVLATVGVTHGFGSRERLEAGGADFVIDSLSELRHVMATLDT